MGGERRGVEGRSEAGEGEWVVRKCRHEGISWRAFKDRTGAPCLVLEKASSGTREMDARGQEEPQTEISCGCL